jgi:hypothetical protein
MLQTSKNRTDINIHQANALKERGSNSSTLTYVYHTVSSSSHAADQYEFDRVTNGNELKHYKNQNYTTNFSTFKISKKRLLFFTKT